MEGLQQRMGLLAAAIQPGMGLKPVQQLVAAAIGITMDVPTLSILFDFARACVAQVRGLQSFLGKPLL